jgi:NosR/NirI family nitrous oxide reductase transcriptional regulator
MDLWFGYLNQPTIGQRHPRGKDGYDGLMSRLKPKASTPSSSSLTNSMDSFKGSGFVRGGLYDRVQVRQDKDSFHLPRSRLRESVGRVKAAGAPDYNESAIFIIRGKSFSARLSLETGFPRQQDRQGNGHQDLRQLRQGILAGSQLSRRRPPRGHQARPDLAQGVEGARRVRYRHLRRRSCC